MKRKLDIERLQDLEVREATQKSIGFRIGVTRKNRSDLVRQGLWWIVPMFRTRIGRGVGIALRPRRAIEECPVVIHKHGVAVTVASRASTSLPMLIYQMALYGSPDLWSRFRDAPEQLRADLEIMEQALGGQALGGQGGVQTIFRLARDTELIARDDRYNVPLAQQHEAQRTIMEALEPGDDHRHYRRWLATLLQGGPVEPPLPDTLGVWRRRADLATFLMARERGVASILGQAAWTVLQGPASLDRSESGLPGQLMPPVKSSAQNSLIDAAGELRRRAEEFPEEFATDTRLHPLWQPSMQIAQRRLGYDGLAHVEAAAVLDELGQPERAWDALLSAAFWCYSRTGSSFPPAVEAARFLAEKQGWEPIVTHLDRLAELDEA